MSLLMALIYCYPGFARRQKLRGQL